MSSVFRIAINLSNFFADHRRQARICVNDAIQTIGDLQNKISGIFDLHEFYLVCDNDFLPPSEDIHVLQNNDLVWVMPDVSIAPQSRNRHSTPLHQPNVCTSLKQNCNGNKTKILEDVISGHSETEDIAQKKKCRRTANQVENNQELVVSKHTNKHKLFANGTDDSIEEKSPERKKKKKEDKISANGAYNNQKVDSVKKNDHEFFVNGIDHIQESIIPERKKKKKHKISANRVYNIQEIVDSVKKDKHKGFVNETDNIVQETLVPERKKKKKENRFMRFMKSDDSFAFDHSKVCKTDKKKNKNDLDGINLLEHSKTGNSIGNENEEHENDEKTSPSMNTDSNQMVCKGDLTSYRKKQPVPTTTDEYLKEKKINIVKINYVTTTDTSKRNESHNALISKANFHFGNTPQVSLLTNTSPIKFAPELTCIEESSSACSQKSSSNQNTDFINKNEHDMKKSEVPKTDESLKEPPEICITSETQFENAMIFDNKNSVQQCDFEFGIEGSENSHVQNTSIPVVEDGRIIDEQKHDTAEHNRDTKVSKEESGIVSGGTELNISSNNDNQQTFTTDMKTPKNKEWSYKEYSPLSESLLAGFTSSVLESTHSIAVEDIYGKSPFVSGCHWVEPDEKTAKPKHKEVSGVGQLVETLRTAPNGKPQEDVSDVDSFVTVRKRKRTRRRTKKNKFEIDESLIVPPETVPMPKPMITEASPSIHIKFDEDGREDFINSKKEKQECSVAGDHTNDGSYLESYFQMIQKAIPMKDMAPKVGDTIAFKVLKMSESYTPEVSAYVTGKVIKYDSSDGSIKFDILAGLEELKEPNGKLSIVENDDVNQNQQKEYTWTELIEPRLFS